MEWFCKGEHGIWAGCGGKQKQTNADRIRAMTDEKMADIFSLWCCRSTTDDSYCKSFGTCDKCWLDWLKQEASGD